MPRRRRRPQRSGLPGDAWDALYPTLDLHGETGESARRIAEGWLRRQREAGEPVVRLITGWGRHSVGPPVLRGEIEDLLRALRGTVVAGHQIESGGGAVRVDLRRPASAPAPSLLRPRTSVPGDPALRREAEAALEELGIAPTPALLEAEMRRLRKERGRGSA